MFSLLGGRTSFSALAVPRSVELSQRLDWDQEVLAEEICGRRDSSRRCSYGKRRTRTNTRDVPWTPWATVVAFSTSEASSLSPRPRGKEAWGQPDPSGSVALRNCGTPGSLGDLLRRRYGMTE